MIKKGGDLVCTYFKPQNAQLSINIKGQVFLFLFSVFTHLLKYHSDTAYFICYVCHLVHKFSLLPGYDYHVLHCFCALWGPKKHKHMHKYNKPSLTHPIMTIRRT